MDKMQNNNNTQNTKHISLQEISRGLMERKMTQPLRKQFGSFLKN